MDKKITHGDDEMIMWVMLIIICGLIAFFMT